MMAICPVGPPNEMKPSLSQNRNASRNVGWLVWRDVSAVVCSSEIAFIAVAKMRRARQNIQNRDVESAHRVVPLLPNPSARDLCQHIRRAEISRRPNRRHESFRQFSRRLYPRWQNAW